MGADDRNDADNSLSHTRDFEMSSKYKPGKCAEEISPLLSFHSEEVSTTRCRDAPAQSGLVG